MNGVGVLVVLVVESRLRKSVLVSRVCVGWLKWMWRGVFMLVEFIGCV